jgi:hypothetical protein
VPAGGQHALTNIFKSAIGFCVGQPDRSIAILLIDGMSMTSVAFFIRPRRRTLVAGTSGGSNQ